jgi:glycerol-3-phosphate dehydrogenase (NAD(P)+)
MGTMDADCPIGIIGAGAWGTALAQLYATAGRRVTLWAREGAVAQGITAERENTAYLPGVLLHDGIAATTDIGAAAACPVVLLVTPAQHTRAVLGTLPSAPGGPLVVCAKGIERGTGALLPDVVAQACPGAGVAVLSGPSFAGEVARGLPAAVTLACADDALGTALQAALAAPAFRPYRTTDVAGVALAGALKNVVAIACGVVAGRDLGESARAAVLARGLAEMARLAAAVGADAATLMGLAGVGDLVLTATSLQSRNFSLGYALGEGAGAAQVLEGRAAVTEGAHAAGAALTLAERYGVEMPLAAAVDALVAGRAEVGAVMDALLSRPLRPEGA